MLNPFVNREKYAEQKMISDCKVAEIISTKRLPDKLFLNVFK